MGVSKNNDTPKASSFRGFSIINHPFWGTPIFGNTQIIGKNNQPNNRAPSPFLQLRWWPFRAFSLWKSTLNEGDHLPLRNPNGLGSNGTGGCADRPKSPNPPGWFMAEINIYGIWLAINAYKWLGGWLLRTYWLTNWDPHPPSRGLIAPGRSLPCFWLGDLREWSPPNHPESTLRLPFAPASYEHILKFFLGW